MSLNQLAIASAHGLNALRALRPFPTNPATLDVDAACELLATGYNREAEKWGLESAGDSCLRAALFTLTQRFTLTGREAA